MIPGRSKSGFGEIPLMKKAFVTLAFSALALAGCRQEGAARFTAPEQIPAGVRKAFDSAKPEIKAAASDLADAVAGKNYAKAYVQSETLVDNQELSPDQRQTAAQTSMILMRQLAAEAEAGNTEAAEILKTHRRMR